MMIHRRISSTKYFQLLVVLVALLLTQVTNAAGTNTSPGQLAPGSTAVISIDPVLPKLGESFVINITGTWRDSCIPDQSQLTYEISEYTDMARPELKQATIKFKTTRAHTGNCDGEFEPTTFELSMPFQNPNWDSVTVTLDVRESLDEGRHMYWTRSFDLVWGLHEIPPRLGSGYWLSEDAPYQGLLIQQQENTVVFYELTYNRTSGEPNWLYATGKFYGESLNGVGYLVSWLSPVEGATQSFINNPDLNPSIIPINRLVQPERQELLFDSTSAAISVRGVNRISAYVGLHDLDGWPDHPIYHTYKRWVFALGDTQLPPVVPDMIGLWDLYGFSGRHLEQYHQIKFEAGTKVGHDLYRFASTDDEWVLDCQINLGGEGGCTLTNENLGLTLNYAMDSTPFDSSVRYFNGNYTETPLVSSNVEEADQTGILLRSGLRLPVLDLQR